MVVILINEIKGKATKQYRIREHVVIDKQLKI